ncbi:MAG TPA: site-specific DNA-methyltransferase [Spirochaetota bacterium]|nr:site-specific DNA-methyltransferase [Spirochaetota bacterium]HOM39018.1 site-specific DNA-methyltransferase [Spirochaetota bacterium]HPQ49936.1 site-specific DNA-methyltransferase [Spirochaetota bacterium]
MNYSSSENLFNFWWKGKEEAYKAAFNPEFVKSEKIAEYGNKGSKNIVLIGDSLLSLKLLLKNYENKVDLIYIDPPYNTGNSFNYNDKFKIRKDKSIKVNDKRYFNHSIWLNFIYPRLLLARLLLKDNGLIFVSIDDNEYHHLRMILDEIYGEANYVATLCWINNLKGRQIVGYGPAKTYEYIIVYAKNIKNIDTFKIDIEYLEKIDPLNKVYGSFKYKLMKDEHGYFVIKNQLYNSNSYFNEETRPNLVFNIHYNFNTGEIKFSEIYENIEYKDFIKIPPVKNNDGIHLFRAWRWSREKIIKERHNLLFINHNGIVKIYTKVRDIGKTLLKDIIFIPGNYGKKEISNILGFKMNDYPKPIELIKLILKIVSKDSLILDFFAGTGTTGHAVFELNKMDDGNRSFILIQSDEDVNDNNLKKLFPTIDKICIERLKNVCSKYGYGFVVFKVLKT